MPAGEETVASSKQPNKPKLFLRINTNSSWIDCRLRFNQNRSGMPTEVRALNQTCSVNFWLESMTRSLSLAAHGIVLSTLRERLVVKMEHFATDDPSNPCVSFAGDQYQVLAASCAARSTRRLLHAGPLSPVRFPGLLNAEFSIGESAWTGSSVRGLSGGENYDIAQTACGLSHRSAFGCVAIAPPQPNTVMIRPLVTSRAVLSTFSSASSECA